LFVALLFKPSPECSFRHCVFVASFFPVVIAYIQRSRKRGIAVPNIALLLDESLHSVRIGAPFRRVSTDLVRELLAEPSAYQSLASLHSSATIPSFSFRNLSGRVGSFLSVGMLVPNANTNKTIPDIIPRRRDDQLWLESNHNLCVAVKVNGSWYLRPPGYCLCPE